MSIDPALLDGPYDHLTDVGAHTGEFSRACLQEWPRLTVDSFEPLRELVNLPDNGPWRWHRIALCEHTGHWLMWRNEFEPSSSLLPMLEAHREAFPYTRHAITQEVTTGRLSDYGDRVHGRALLKLDVQGTELRVLKGAGDVLNRFDAIVLEVSHVPLYQGSATPIEISEFLRAHGFTHKARVDVTRHPVTRQVLQSDELWTGVR